MYLSLVKGCASFMIAILGALFGRLKDVSGCSAAPEEFSPTAFLALFWVCGAQIVFVWGGCSVSAGVGCCGQWGILVLPRHPLALGNIALLERFLRAAGEG